MTALPTDPSDDDLYAAMATLLDGPVLINQHSLKVLGAWVAATRELVALRDK